MCGLDGVLALEFRIAELQGGDSRLWVVKYI